MGDGDLVQAHLNQEVEPEEGWAALKTEKRQNDIIVKFFSE